MKRKSQSCAVRFGCLLIAAVLLMGHAVIPAAAYSTNNNPLTEVGSTVLFGTYEQDGNTGNGSEMIEWIVMDYDSSKNRSLLLSKNILEILPYNDKKKSESSLIWGYSDLRQWLKSDFLNSAFTTQQQRLIVTTTNSTNDFMSRKGGGKTDDAVFLLSRAEAKDYFQSDRDRVADLTEYALAKAKRSGVTLKNGTDCWWLRSPGGYKFDFSAVETSGTITYGKDAQKPHGVRPALWIDTAAATAINGNAQNDPMTIFRDGKGNAMSGETLADEVDTMLYTMRYLDGKNALGLKKATVENTTGREFSMPLFYELIEHRGAFSSYVGATVSLLQRNSNQIDTILIYTPDALNNANINTMLDACAVLIAYTQNSTDLDAGRQTLKIMMDRLSNSGRFMMDLNDMQYELMLNQTGKNQYLASLRCTKI